MNKRCGRRRSKITNKMKDGGPNIKKCRVLTADAEADAKCTLAGAWKMTGKRSENDQKMSGK